MIDFDGFVIDLPPSEQVALALDCLQITARYGASDPSVVDPLAAEAVADACWVVMNRYPEEPEDDQAFFALGAVVGLFYAARAVAGMLPSSGVDAAKRFLDTIGFADDAMEARLGKSPGAFDLGLRFLSTRSPDDAAALQSFTAEHADLLGGR